MKKVNAMLLGVALLATTGVAQAKGLEAMAVAVAEPVTVNDSLTVSFFVPDPAAMMLRNRLVNTPAPGTIVDGPIGSMTNN